MSLFQCRRGSDFAKLEMIAAIKHPPDGKGTHFKLQGLNSSL